jgi:hypothetical protein
MKLKALLLSLVCLSLPLLSGCFDRSVDDQSIPWGRPAAWEDQAPGMGGF